MATIEQLEDGLRKAHAAGNADHARRFADEIRRMRAEAPAADPFRHPDGRLTEQGWENERAQLRRDQQQEIDDQGFWQNFVAGYGRALPVMWSGIKQAGTEAAARSVRNSVLTANTLGAETVGAALARHAGVPLQDSLASQQREIDSERAATADLMDTGGGLLGNITGNVVPMAVAGLAGTATKAPAVSQALLPNTMAGNVAQGVSMGFLQPTATGESRAANATLGGAAGGAAHGLTQAPGLLAKVLPGVRRGAQETKAAAVLDGFASDAGAVRAALGANQSLLPGSLPTTAEATGDVGLAQLQRVLQGNNAGGFNAGVTLRQEANNAARVGAVRDAFGGAEDAGAEAIREARDLAARQTLRPIEGVPVDMAPVKSAVTKLAQKHGSSKVVREALADVQEELGTIKTVQDAHNVRQYIGQLLSGRLDGKAGAQFAKKQLLAVRDHLDRTVRQAVPEWGDFLRNYRSSSREADQVAFGARLLDKSNAARDVGGNPVLNSMTLRAMARPDSVARAANPGFRGASADSMLTQPQQEVVDAVRRDLERQVNTWSRGRVTGGSDTFQKLAGGAQLQQEYGQWVLPMVGAIDPTGGVATGAINSARTRGGDKVASLVAEAMLDPQRAAEILARAPTKQRKMATAIVANAFRQTVQGAERTRQSQRPLEIDIIGGRREAEAGVPAY